MNTRLWWQWRIIYYRTERTSPLQRKTWQRNWFHQQDEFEPDPNVLAGIWTDAQHLSIHLSVRTYSPQSLRIPAPVGPATNRTEVSDRWLHRNWQTFAQHFGEDAGTSGFKQRRIRILCSSKGFCRMAGRRICSSWLRHGASRGSPGWRIGSVGYYQTKGPSKNQMHSYMLIMDTTIRGGKTGILPQGAREIEPCRIDGAAFGPGNNGPTLLYHEDRFSGRAGSSRANNTLFGTLAILAQRDN